MYVVALRMDWLHKHDIIHRDFKASNVVVSRLEKGWTYCAADFECIIRVVGTGLFRAPEILQACKDKNISPREELFIKEVDVYSYGMTRYEILPRKLPSEGHPMADYDLVLNGHRPKVPEYVEDWTHELLKRCWQSEPADRRLFGEILGLLASNSGAIRVNLRQRQ